MFNPNNTHEKEGRPSFGSNDPSYKTPYQGRGGYSERHACSLSIGRNDQVKRLDSLSTAVDDSKSQFELEIADIPEWEWDKPLAPAEDGEIDHHKLTKGSCPQIGTDVASLPPLHPDLNPNRLRDGPNSASSLVQQNQKSSPIRNKTRAETRTARKEDKNATESKKKRRRSSSGTRKNGKGQIQEANQSKLSSFFPLNNKPKPNENPNSLLLECHPDDIDDRPLVLNERSDDATAGSQMTQEDCQRRFAMFTQTLTQYIRRAQEKKLPEREAQAVVQGGDSDDEDGAEGPPDMTEQDLSSTLLALSQTADDAHHDATMRRKNAGILIADQSNEFIYNPRAIGEPARTYRKNEVWVGPKNKLYTIVGFRLRGCPQQKAICRENIRLSKTFLGSKMDGLSDFLCEQGNAALEQTWIEREVRVEVDLKDLKSQRRLSPWEREEYRWQSKGAALGIDDEKKLNLATRFDFAYAPKDEDTNKVKVWGCPSVLDLFAGVGGMSIGLEQVGFRVTHAVEVDDLAAASYQHNSTHKVQMYCECVNEFLDKVERGAPGYPTKGSIQHIHASSPCEGASKANRAPGGGKAGQKNNELALTWARAIRLIETATASFENVTGFVQKKDVLVYLKQMVAEVFLELHYSTRVCILNAARYGDPQNRFRVIILASKKGVPLSQFPTPTHGGPGLPNYRTVNDVIADLQAVEPETGCGRILLDGAIVSNHSTDGTELKSESKRLDPNHPASTLYGQSTNSFVHPHVDRGLTTRELARLQSFPDGHEFPTNRNVARKQIFNAVPIHLARAIGKSLLDCYDVQEHDSNSQ